MDLRMLVYHRMQGLLQTAIPSVNNIQIKKNSFSEEVIQGALFKTLVMTIVFKS